MRGGGFGVGIWAFASLLVAGGVGLSVVKANVDAALARENGALLAGLHDVAYIAEAAQPPLSLGEEKILNDFRPDRDRPQALRARLPIAPDAAAFAADPAISAVTMSPSGRYLGTVQKGNGASLAVVYDLDGLESPVALDFRNYSVDSIVWADDDRLLIGYSLLVVFQIFDLEFYFGGARVLAVDRNGSNPVTLFDGAPSVAANNFNLTAITHKLPQDPDHVLMPATENGRLGVWKVNIRTGGAELIERGTPETGAWFTDKNGAPIIRIDSNRRRDFLHVFAKQANGEWREIASGPWTTHRAPNIWPVATSGAAGAVIVKANTEGEDRTSIKEFDTATGGFRRTVFAHPSVDVGGAVKDASDGAYLGAWYVEDHYSVAFEDKILQAHYDGLRRFFDDTANVYVSNASTERDRLLLFVEGPQDAGDFYQYDYSRKTVTPLFTIYPDLPRESLGRMETVKFAARDGVPLTAYLTHPPQTDGEPLPLIVLPHGGPESRDMIGFHFLAQFLATRGYRVLQPNFRGSSGYGSSFAEAGYGEWGRKMQDDITDAVHVLEERGLVSNGEICIVGASYGGYAALVAATKEPSIYRCAVSVSGVSDLFEFLEFRRRLDTERSDAYEYWLTAIGDPQADRAALRENSPRLAAARARIPVLLIHGAKDETVPVEQSRIMYNALLAADKDVSYIEYPEAGHSDWDAETTTAFLRALHSFIGANIYRRQSAALADPTATAEREAAAG